MHTPRLVDGDRVHAYITLSPLDPISPIVAWVHYASVFPEQVGRVRSFDTLRNVASTIADRAVPSAVNEFNVMKNERQRMTVDEIICRMNWPLWLRRYKDRLMEDTYKIFWRQRFFQMPETIHYVELEFVRAVAIVFDSIGEANFESVFMHP